MGTAHPAMEPEPPCSGLWRAPIARFNTNRNGNLPLPRPMTRIASLSTAALLGGFLLALGSSALPRPALAATGPFTALTGSWSGTGTIQPGNGTTERIRCNANYRPRGSSGNEVDLDLRCASDSYNFELTGQFTADAGNHITGQWTERTRNIGGSGIGTVGGDQITVHVESGAFSANLALVTRGRRQNVTINSPGGGKPVKAAITLSRR